MIFLLQMSVDSINYITLFKPGCFVPRMDKVLLQHVGRFNVNQEMMFIEDPPEILRFSSDPCCDFDPGVAHISEPVARSSSCQCDQGSVLTSPLYSMNHEKHSALFYFFLSFNLSEKKSKLSVSVPV